MSNSEKKVTVSDNVSDGLGSSTTSSSSCSSESVSVYGSGTGTTGSSRSGRGRSNVRVKKVNFEETVKSYSPFGLSESSPISTRSSSRSKTIVKSNQQARSGTSGSQSQQPMKNCTGGSVNSPSTPKSGTGSMKSPPSPSSSTSGAGGSVKSSSSMKSGTGGSVKSPSPSPPSSPRSVLPAGNICLLGVVKTGMASRREGKVSRTLIKNIMFPYDEFIRYFNWDNPGFPPCGLLNSGNSCFANVVLQCLSHTRPLVAYLLEKGHQQECRLYNWCFLCEFQTHVERGRNTLHSFSPMNILSRLPNIGGNLGHGKQEDAHEFMRFAIDTMQAVCLEEFGREKAVHPSSQDTTLIQHIFGGHLQSQVICTNCNKISNQYESMMDLTVEIHGDAASLEECLDQFTVKEWLHGDNMYKCDGCDDYVKAWKRLTVRQAPNILTIALKRFQSGRFGKLNKRVTFPETLDLSPYMTEAVTGADVYKLYAVVVHLDMLNASDFGHYICYIKNFSGNWYLIDDCKVVKVDLEEVLSEGAYMLLYSRVDARPSCLEPIEALRKEERLNVNVTPEIAPSNPSPGDITASVDPHVPDNPLEYSIDTEDVELECIGPKPLVSEEIETHSQANTGNICLLGVVKTGMASICEKTDKLGPGTGSYGHRSLMQAGAVTKKGSESSDPEELQRLGNEEYDKGNFEDASRFYDRAISLLLKSSTGGSVKSPFTPESYTDSMKLPLSPSSLKARDGIHRAEDAEPRTTVHAIRSLTSTAMDETSNVIHNEIHNGIYVADPGPQQEPPLTMGTIIALLVLKDDEGLLVASDTQSTRPNNSRDDSAKVHIINGKQILAGAGCVYTEMNKKYAAMPECSVEIGGQRITKLWADFAKEYNGANCSYPSINANNARYLLCAMEGGKPSIVHIYHEFHEETDEDKYQYEKLLTRYFSMGTGSVYADTVLKAQDTFELAIDNITDAVALAIENDPHCGGSINLAVMRVGCDAYCTIQESTDLVKSYVYSLKMTDKAALRKAKQD